MVSAAMQTDAVSKPGMAVTGCDVHWPMRLWELGEAFCGGSWASAVQRVSGKADGMKKVLPKQCLN